MNQLPEVYTKQLSEEIRPIIREETGVEQGVKKVILEMLKKGLSTNLIMEVTQLEESEIEKLREML